MATIKKVGDRWHARVRKRGVDAFQTFRTKSEATAWASRVETEIEDKRLGKIPDKTFGDLLKRYIDEVSPTKDGHRSNVVRYQALISRNDPILFVGLRHIDASHFSEWRDRRLSCVKSSTVQREWNMLSAVCTRAVKEWRWLSANPLSEVSRPPGIAPRNRLIDDSELTLLDGAVEKNIEASTYRVYLSFLFGTETALRAGEICALDWPDVDMKARILTVCQTKAGARKTRTSRIVPLSKPAIDILKQLHGFHPLSVFSLTPASVDALFRKLKAKAGVSGFTYHDGRALALTRMSKKLNPLQLAKIAGHTDLAMLTKVYYRENPGDWAELLD